MIPHQLRRRDFPAAAGYWAGGFFCALSVLSLSLGLVPLVQAFFDKPRLIQIPGRETLDLELPGTYIGVARLSGIAPEEKIKVMNMDYWLSDSGEKDFFPVNKFPQRNYYSDKEDAQSPLFEAILDKKGKYLFTSDYPIGVEGPKVSALLYRYDAEHVRSELAIGVIVSLGFGALGGYFLWGTYKSSRSYA